MDWLDGRPSRQAGAGPHEGPTPFQGQPALDDRLDCPPPPGGEGRQPAILDGTVEAPEGPSTLPDFLQEIGEFQEITVHPMALKILQSDEPTTKDPSTDLWESD